jgi:hypothetical protein
MMMTVTERRSEEPTLSAETEIESETEAETVNATAPAHRP